MRRLVLTAAAVCFGGCSDTRPFNVDGGDQLRAGAAYVDQRGCASCHQSGARHVLDGASTPLAGTAAYGGNLTPDRSTGLGTWADVEIIRALRFGFDPAGQPLCPSMPRYPTMGDVEVGAIVAYLRSLPSVSNAVPGSMCPPVKPPPAPDMAAPATDM